MHPVSSRSLFQELRFLRREILPDFTVAAYNSWALCAHRAVPPRSEKLVSTRIADHRCVIRCAHVVRSTRVRRSVPREWTAADHFDVKANEGTTRPPRYKLANAI